MGHELAHTILHHGGQDWSNMATALIVQLALLSVLDSTCVSTLFWELFGTGALFCTFSFKRFAFLVPSTRACESEADMLGLSLVAKARYNPARAVDLFQRFKAFERTHGVRIHRFFCNLIHKIVLILLVTRGVLELFVVSSLRPDRLQLLRVNGVEGYLALDLLVHFFRFYLPYFFSSKQFKVYGNRVWDSNHPPTAERVAAILAATPDAMLAYQVPLKPLLINI